MPITVIEGEQRGDEGKGRFVDMYAEEYGIGARFNGGDNAGHTIVSADGEVYKLHGLPSTIIHPGKKSVIGNGTVINALNLVREMEKLRSQGVEISPDNLLISSGAHLSLPHHRSEDEIREGGEGRQGSTKAGIAYAYSDKAEREGVRAEDIKNNPQKLFEVVEKGLLAQRHCRVEEWLPPIDEEAAAFEYVEAAQQLGEFVTDTALFLNRELEKGTKILAEAAQAFLLDVDHGMYPYVTSSNTISGAVSTGLGVPPESITHVIGISKAVQSHVGDGPFVTEITKAKDPELLERLHGDMDQVDSEKGTKTGRVRRLGYLDLAGIKRSQMINGTKEMNITKLDWVPRYGRQVLVCVAHRRKGNTLEVATDAAYKLEQSRPYYALLDTWEEDIQGVREFEDLPENAQDYVNFITEITGVPVTRIGVGPQRDQVIVRK